MFPSSGWERRAKKLIKRKIVLENLKESDKEEKEKKSPLNMATN